MQLYEIWWRVRESELTKSAREFIKARESWWERMECGETRVLMKLDKITSKKGKIPQEW